MEENIKVYIRINDRNCVTGIDSSIFIGSTVGWICIDEGQGDRYSHAQGMYLENGLMDMMGRYNYKYESNTLSLLTNAEKLVLYPPTIKPPTELERIESLEDAVNVILTIM